MDYVILKVAFLLPCMAKKNRDYSLSILSFMLVVLYTNQVQLIDDEIKKDLNFVAYNKWLSFR